MASPHWRTGLDIGSLYKQRDTGWEFLQLVRLLLYRESAEDGASEFSLLDKLTKRIRFKASLAADFPPGEIRVVDYQGPDKPAEIASVSGVLTSHGGPLPEPFISWLRELDSHGDTAMAEFLDLFNNRLLALRYLACRSTRPTLVDMPLERSEPGRLLIALAKGARDSPTLKRELELVGLISSCRMSLPVIRSVLYVTLGLYLASMDSLEGGWLRVDQRDHSHLGSSVACTLGRSATLGKRIWDQHKSVNFTIGPLPWDELRELIPGGQRHAYLATTLRRVADGGFDCHVTLLLRHSDIPAALLGEGRARSPGVLALGLTAALKASQEKAAYSQDLPVKFTVTATRAAP
jgi:type VI secretion system protein ImpH